MKKITILAVCLSAAIAYSRVSAQGLQDRSVAGGNHFAIHLPPGAEYGDDSSALPAEAGSINRRAMKDFKSRFAKVNDAKWFAISSGFYSYFAKDGTSERVFYDKKGRWTASINYCDGTKLPHDVRDQVRREFLDFTIFGVLIVDVPEHTAYLVYIQDSTSWKILRVNDQGEMDILHEYTK